MQRDKINISCEHLLIYDAASIALPNVASVTFAEDHGGYLAGVICATLTKSQIVGFIGGIDVPSVRR